MTGTLNHKTKLIDSKDHFFDYFLAREEVPKDDPYGSLWMETQEPVKIKKRRRSNIVLDLPIPVSVVEDDFIPDTDNGSDASRQCSAKCGGESCLENDNAKKIWVDRGTVYTDSHRSRSGEQKDILNVRITDSMITTQHNTENSCIIADSAEKAGFKTDIVSEVNQTDSQQFTESATDLKKEETQVRESNTDSTPPYDIKTMTPQSMSPEYPLSPSDVEYFGTHDASFTFLPQSKLSDRSYVDKVNVTNENETTDRLMVRRIAEESNKLELSNNSLEVSVSDKENTVLSSSDKENTVIENKSDDHIDEGRSSESSGFLSLCKTFAGKVVDMVKTSPSYLTNILQDRKDKNSDSPVNDVLAKTVLSPGDSNDKSLSEIKLDLGSELNKNIVEAVQSPKQVIQVYSVTEITKGNQKAENSGRDDHEKADKETEKRNDDIHIIKEVTTEKIKDDCNIIKEVTMKETKPMKSVADKAKSKRRKSSSKIFFDTFNAVSKELNKVSNSKFEMKGEISNSNSERIDDKQADEIDGFSECKSITSVSNGVELKVNQDETALSVQGEEINIEKKNFEHVKTSNIETYGSCNTVDIKKKDNDTSKCFLQEKTNLLKKRRKRRSTDIDILSNDSHLKEKHKKDENSNNSARKAKELNLKGSSVSQASFTQIKKVEQAREIELETDESSESVTADETHHSSSGTSNISRVPSLDTNNTVDIADSTSSVLEGISKLDLDLTLPMPSVAEKHMEKNKKDRRRRRSNNFYFSSIYEENEGNQTEKSASQSTSSSVDKTNAEIQESKILEAHVLDSRIHTVTEEISQVEITDKRRKEKCVKEDVNRVPDIEKVAEIELKNSESVAIEREAPNDSVIDSRDSGVSISQSVNVMAETVEDVAPRRRRRRSADAAILKIQMHALDQDISPVPEQAAASPGPSSQKGRKRKKAEEIPLEDIYRNKNYVKPQDKTWETIFESPKADQLFSKRKLHTCFNFEENTYYKPSQDKVKKRQKRAIKNGWDPKKRKRQAISEDTFQVKIGNIFADLDGEENSISEKIKDTISY